MRRPLIVFAAIACPVLLSALAGGPSPIAAAHAQMVTSREGIALEDQILALKQKIQALQQSGGNGGSALGQSQPGASQSAGGGNQMVANLLQQVRALQDQVQSLHGELDQIRHKEQTDHDQLAKQIGDLEFQLQQNGTIKPSGGTPASAGSGSGGPAAGSSGRTLGTMPAGKPEGAGSAAQHSSAAQHGSAAKVEPSLTAARHALDHHDAKTAEADARAVIAKHGKGAYHGAAELVLGQAYANQGRHRQAALAYDDAYSADKHGPHAPEALLGLASSLTAIHQTEAACDTLKSLTSQFPHPSASVAKGVRRTRAQAHCH